MLKKRIIPVLLLRNGYIVQSRNFNRYQLLGTPSTAVERLTHWNADELIYLDISQESYYDLKRNDLNYPEFSEIADIIRLVATRCFMPLTFGGKIRQMNDVHMRITSGADKVTLNTIAFDDLKFIEQAAKIYGSQAIVVSVDVRYESGKYALYKGGKIKIEKSLAVHIRDCQNAGAGEFLINSMDRDGSLQGFDLELINEACNYSLIPVIALGGAGKAEHFEDVLNKTNASAVAAANIFWHSENSYFNIKKYLFDKSFNVRAPGILSMENKNI